MSAIQGVPQLPKVPKGPWAFFLDALGTTVGSVSRVPQPVGALALIALGFFAARLTGAWSAVPGPVSTGGMAPSADVFATVRSVQPGDGGRVQIAFDETRRRVVSGRTDDQGIQKLLLAASQEENADVRVESVGLLRSRSNSTEVRDALLNRVATDPNDGVRLKALEGLTPLAGDPDVRRTLAQVLRTDPNPAMRMQAVDLLVAHRDDAVVGVLQGMVQREDDRTVRLKLEKALKDMNASIGTF
jgi:hypothetical protein